MIHKVMHSGSSTLRPLTLRNLPPDVARAVRERALADGISLNKAVIRILEEALGVARPKRPRTYEDLDELIGSWTDREAREMERFLEEERKVEPEMWR